MRTRSILIVSFVSIFLFNCKKENEKEVTFLKEYAQKSLPIQSNGRMVDMAENDEEYTILIDRGYPVVLRMNVEGEVLWEKEFTQYSVGPHNLEVTIDGSCFFTINYYDQYFVNHAGLSPFSGYFSDQYNCATKDSTIDAYILTIDSLVELVDNSTTKLIKLNSNGEFIGEMDFNLLQNGDLLHENSNKLFLTTTYNSDLTTNFILDFKWGNIPRVSLEPFNSRLIFNEIDPVANSVQRTISSVNEQESEFQFPSEFTFGKMLFINTSAVLCSDYNIIKITGNGLPTSISTKFSSCENGIYKYQFKSMAKGLGERVILLGTYSKADSLESVNFITELDLYGNEIWMHQIDNNLVNPSIIRSGTDNGFFLRSNDNNIHKYDNSGRLRWTANSSALRNFTDIMVAHNGGVSIIESDGKDFFIKQFTEL